MRVHNRKEQSGNVWRGGVFHFCLKTSAEEKFCIVWNLNNEYASPIDPFYCSLFSFGASPLPQTSGSFNSEPPSKVVGTRSLLGKDHDQFWPQFLSLRYSMAATRGLAERLRTNPLLIYWLDFHTHLTQVRHSLVKARPAKDANRAPLQSAPKYLQRKKEDWVGNPARVYKKCSQIRVSTFLPPRSLQIPTPHLPI